MLPPHLVLLLACVAMLIAAVGLLSLPAAVAIRAPVGGALLLALALLFACALLFVGLGRLLERLSTVSPSAPLSRPGVSSTAARCARLLGDPSQKSTRRAWRWLTADAAWLTAYWGARCCVFCCTSWAPPGARPPWRAARCGLMLHV